MKKKEIEDMKLIVILISKKNARKINVGRNICVNINFNDFSMPISTVEQIFEEYLKFENGFVRVQLQKNEFQWIPSKYIQRIWIE